ncbi:MAG: metabolite traffic protein EboE [Pirellulaceae bacterium]|nr:metabolite traffic protein EboE [Pirellulaceae bacterium]
MDFSYCTNLHSAENLEELKRNLLAHFRLEQSLDIDPSVKGTSTFESGARPRLGLWFSGRCARELVEKERCRQFRSWLEKYQFSVTTINGFPYGDFHGKTVKHSVYAPSWAQQDRLDYTRNLVVILTELLPEGKTGTISTVPIGWAGLIDNDCKKRAAQNLLTIVTELEENYQQSGKKIVLCLEPEPGCLLEQSDQVVTFFERYLYVDQNEGGRKKIRRHLQVCHDVCHSAVMFEPQQEAVKTYRRGEIGIGKVQISSALSVPFAKLSLEEKKQALRELGNFAEDRYLHQSVLVNDHGERVFFDDLPKGLKELEKENVLARGTELRVHFHVPIFADRLGLLSTTQEEIGKFLSALEEYGGISPEFEIETYAWSVLPDRVAPVSGGDQNLVNLTNQETLLAEGIAQECRWFHNLLESRSSSKQKSKIAL